MGRKIKNIICILLVLLMGVMVYLTMNYAKNNISNNQVNNNMMGGMSEPPEKPNDMNDNSYYERIINGENTAKSIELVLDNKLTGDSYATSLVNSISDNSNINFNGYKLYVNGIAIN